jgi:hypothetical protein
VTLCAKAIITVAAMRPLFFGANFLGIDGLWVVNVRLPGE